MVIGALAILVVAIIVLLTLVIVRAHRLSNDDEIHIPEPQNDGTVSRKRPASIAYLDNVNAITDQWERMVTIAESSVVLTTYRWRVDPNDVSGHILAIGRGLARRNTPLDVTIVINRMLWTESNSFIKQHIDDTITIWSDTCGVSTEQLERIQWCTWTHAMINNLHTKILYMDKGVAATIHTCNIEPYSNGGPDTWKECGVYLTDMDADHNRCIDDHLDHIMASVNKVSATIPESTGICKYTCQPPPRSPETTTAPVTILTKKQDGNLFNTNIKHCDMTLAILDMIRSAKHGIQIWSPNFNSRAILSAIPADVDTHLVVNSEFNNEVPLIQKTLLGSMTNEKFEQQNDITFDYHTDRYGAVVKGKSNNASHVKKVIVDDDVVMVGSFNLDTFSLYGSLEMSVIVS